MNCGANLEEINMRVTMEDEDELEEAKQLFKDIAQFLRDNHRIDLASRLEAFDPDTYHYDWNS